MALTDTACKNAKCPPDKPRKRFTDSGGMYLEVQPNGAKHWRWKYRFGGKEKRLALGTYPAVSLADARREREKAREILARGTDPVQARQEAKLAQQVRIENTFKAVALAWWEHWRGTKTERHADYVKRRLEADVFPVIGATPVADIAAPKLLMVARKIEGREALDIAKRSLQTCGQILRYAVAHGHIERNPAADVKPADALKPRKKVNYARVDAKELPQLLRRMETYTGSPYTRLAMKLMALTFVRRISPPTKSRPSRAFPGRRPIAGSRSRTRPATGRRCWRRSHPGDDPVGHASSGTMPARPRQACIPPQ